ncbi:MAG: amino acid ABC transporter permease [Terrimesophilobacter sp.]
MNVVIDHLPFFLGGVLVTVQLALWGFLGASVIGVLVGACRVGPVPSLRVFAALYVEILRSLPITVILVFLYFAMPEVKITLSGFSAAAVGLSLYYAAYIAEAVRSGVNAVPKGHVDAGRALGLNYMLLLRRIVLPQALRNVVPPIGNIFLDVAKNTSIAYTITVLEITGRATDLVSRFAEPTAVFAAAAVAYLVLTIPLGLFFRKLEKRTAILR